MWNDVVYEPGEIKVVAYDQQGKAVEEKTVKTAGKPYRIELIPDRKNIHADGKDLAYINVRVVDKDGNLCPMDNRMIQFSVKGNGSYKAAANGDPTSLDLFHKPQMPLFYGQLTTIVQSSEEAGKLTLTAQAKGVKSASIAITTNP